MKIKRNGSILAEMLVALVLCGAILGLGYQMIGVLQKESHQIVNRIRKREGDDIASRLKMLTATLHDLTIHPTWITFSNDQKKPCSIFLRKQRIIYQKNDVGNYVLATRVKDVSFRLKGKKVWFEINYLDGTYHKGQLGMMS